MKWIPDPKTKEPSVSLTLLVVSFLGLVIVGALEIFQMVKTTSVFETLFMTTSGLYFGRRLSLGKDTKSLE